MGLVVAETAQVRTRPGRALIWATAGWAAFLLAHLALSGRWWFWQIPASLPPVLLVAIPVLLLMLAVLGRQANRWLAGALVACLALGAPRSGLRFPLAGESFVPAGAIRVFAWNTEYWDQDEDPEHFYRYLRAQRADVYLLQEYLGWDLADPIDGQRPVDDLARLRREFPDYQIAVRGELLTLSRYPIAAQPAVAPDHGSGDFETQFRDAKVLRTDLRVGERILSVYNVHIAVQLKLVNPLSRACYAFVRRADPQRRAQYRGLAQDLAANPHPVLLAGDFNTSPAMPELTDISDRLRDAVAASPSAYPATWPASAPLWRLDWAFTSATLRTHSYRLVSPETLSDHLGQSLTVSLPAEPPGDGQADR
ncbi:endonuclease/exonuclease/phosphatase family protein [Longispora albida]|uniref:endonuclease/exonuclease/phosphatase family protein n=1 Tax=Longispora albida TaxID=203523 RepID=UPI00036924EB|nr:endonuclease/exonuclease/phosphatase family protein [Longispora albida]